MKNEVYYLAVRTADMDIISWISKSIAHPEVADRKDAIAFASDKAAHAYRHKLYVTDIGKIGGCHIVMVTMPITSGTTMYVGSSDTPPAAPGFAIALVKYGEVVGYRIPITDNGTVWWKPHMSERKRLAKRMPPECPRCLVFRTRQAADKWLRRKSKVANVADWRVVPSPVTGESHTLMIYDDIY